MAGEDKRKSTTASTAGAIPPAVVSRLSLYLRELQHLVRQGHETVSSNMLGPLLGFSDAQVRKDLAHFGQFGYPGIGYRCPELIDAIKRILGTDRRWPVAVVGMGNLGQALIGHKGFERQGFSIVAAFDVDDAKVGKRIADIPILPLGDLARATKELGIQMAMLAVPASAAQSVADQAAVAGIRGIVNFAPVTISLPKGVHQVGVDLAMELEQLSFAVARTASGRDVPLAASEPSTAAEESDVHDDQDAIAETPLAPDSSESGAG